MEVHHHPHLPHDNSDNHRKKKFKEYFLEFLMIFLAVTLGFFAESLREVIKENKIAKELASSLYRDLRSDTAAINKITVSRTYKEIQMDSLFELLQPSPGRIKAVLFFQLVIPFLSTNDFGELQSTGALAQLNNAGYLRYYTHTAIPRAIAGYESSVNSLLLMEKNESQEISDHGISFLREEIDPALFNAGYGNKNISAGAFIVPASPNGFRLFYGNCVAIGIYNRNINHHYLPDVRDKAIRLMAILKTTYHLKNE